MPGRFRRTAVAAVVALSALAVGALVAPVAAHADDTCTVSWRGGVGSWGDATRWSPARVPTSDDDVCVIRAAGADPVSVRLTATTDLWHLTLRGATFSVPTDTFFDVHYIDASRATLTGGGEIRGATGIIDLADTQLRGIQMSNAGGLRLGGQITFTGGSSVDAFGFTDPKPGVRIVDADGNGANHITVTNFPLYLFGPVFVGVGLELRDVSLFAQRGDVVLAKLDNLDSAGRLRASSRSNLQIGTTAGASLTLQRTVTSIGGNTSVFGGDVRTPDGSSALSGLTTVDGSLDLGSAPFNSGATITVRGRLTAAAVLNAPDIRVRPGAYLDVDGVTGALTCGGRCLLAGAHVGALTLLTGADVSTDLTQPIRVDGAARLGGGLTVSLFSGNPQPGDTFVLLTAARGVTGTFGSVATDRHGRTVTPTYRPTYVTGTLGAAA